MGANLMTGVLIRNVDTDSDTQGEGHVTTGSGWSAVSAAREHHGSLAITRSR